MVRKRRLNDRQQVGPARYWTVAYGASGELRVEPSGLPGLSLLMLVVFGLLAVLIWFIPNWEMQTRILCTVGVVVMGFVAQVAASGQHAYELRQPPFLIMDKAECRLRGDSQIPLDQLREFAIVSQKDLEGTISELMLCCKSGEEHFVLSSLNGRDVAQLKTMLDGYVERLHA